MDRRPTMADIAGRAGVSRMAVSYALNGRARRLRRAARADPAHRRRARLQRQRPGAGAARGRGPGGRADHARPSATAFNVEVFRRELISGIQSVLMGRGFGLALQSVADVEDELAVYRRWSSERRVAGVLVCDLGGR